MRYKKMKRACHQPSEENATLSLQLVTRETDHTSFAEIISAFSVTLMTQASSIMPP
jgi:hypothetical protein